MALNEAIDRLPKPEPPWRENELRMLSKAKGEDQLGSSRFSVGRVVSRLAYSWDQCPTSSKQVGLGVFAIAAGAVYLYSRIYHIQLSV